MAKVEHVLIKADKIFLRSKGFLKEHQILMKSGFIDKISKDLKSAPDIKVIDYSSYTITSAFCDHHVHFFDPSRVSVERIKESLLTKGIHTVYDGGDLHMTASVLRNEDNPSLHIKTPGYALYKKGGYGKFLGKMVENADHARHLIDGLIKLNVDYIKIVNSGVFDPGTATITKGGFEREELHNIVKYSNDNGLDVFCHANGDLAIRDAIDAGVNAIIHGFFISDESLSLMAGYKTAFIPTIGALSNLSEIAKSSKAKGNIRKLVDQHLIAINKASQYGVQILAGSDAGPSFIPYGVSFHNELDRFNKAGLTPRQILTSATCSELAVGQKADFLVLDGLKVKDIFTAESPESAKKG